MDPRRPTLFVGNHSVYGVLDVLLFADGLYRERGFVQLAIEHGYTITPYATAGAEEAFDLLLDSADYMNTPLGRYLKRTGIADRYLRGGDEFPPLVRGLGFTAVPRPERMYFSIGRPIDMARYRGQEENPEVLRRVRNRVGRSLEQLIAELRAHREGASRQGPLRRMLNRL